MEKKQIRHLLAFMVLSVILFAESAFAYIDPGTGSALVQAIIASFFGIAVIVKLFGMRTYIFFKKIFKSKTNDS